MTFLLSRVNRDMDRQTALLLALGGLALAALASEAGASWSSGPDPTPPIYPEPDAMTTNEAIGTISAQDDPLARVQAFLAAIRHFEARGDYTILYGGGHFSDFSRHPRIAVPINLPGYAGKKSTAAGAYQINAPTYDDFAPRLGITDFSPASQDYIAIAILKKTGAYDAILAGDIATAFRLASKRWASLPGSTANQNPQTEQVAMNWYDQFLTDYS